MRSAGAVRKPDRGNYIVILPRNDGFKTGRTAQMEDFDLSNFMDQKMNTPGLMVITLEITLVWNT